MNRNDWMRLVVAKCAKCDRSLSVDAPVGSAESEDFIEFANEFAQAVIDGWGIRKQGYLCPACATA